MIFLLRLVKANNNKGASEHKYLFSRIKKIMSKSLNLLLLISFVITLMIPITGIHVHKMASVLFLLFCIIHTIIYRKKLKNKSWLLLAVIILSFLTGIFGMIFDQYNIILQMHKVISIGVVFFLAIHIFVFHKRLMK